MRIDLAVEEACGFLCSVCHGPAPRLPGLPRRRRGGARSASLPPRRGTESAELLTQPLRPASALGAFTRLCAPLRCRHSEHGRVHSRGGRRGAEPVCVQRARAARTAAAGAELPLPTGARTGVTLITS